MLADFYTKFLQYSRRFSFGKTSRDTGVSNPPRSASQSSKNALSPRECLRGELKRAQVNALLLDEQRQGLSRNTVRLIGSCLSALVPRRSTTVS